MAHCTIDDLTDRYGETLLIQLSDRGGAVPVAPDANLFARAIADADALIDGYLAPRYALPLAATPAIVTDIAQRIAIYNAHGQTVAEKIRDDYRAALAQLKDIASGAIVLDVAGAEPASSGSLEVRTNQPARPITAATMKGYI